MVVTISGRLLRIRHGYALLLRLLWTCSPGWTLVGLADGRGSEVGTHADLVQAGGGYAQLYALQARGYF